MSRKFDPKEVVVRVVGDNIRLPCIHGGGPCGCGFNCPKCNAPEMHPHKNALLIRAFKVFAGGAWRSECLVCASADGAAKGGYDENLEWNYDLQFERGENSAWF